MLPGPLTPPTRGFQSFFGLGMAYSILALLVWLATLHGYWAPQGYLQGVAWHAHEMLFGFAAAIMVGYMLAAAPGWSGGHAPSQPAVQGLLGLWLLGRLGVLFFPAWLAAILDFAFLPLAAIALYRALNHKRDLHRFFLPGALLALSLSNGVFHLSQLGLLPLSPLQALVAALYLITLLEITITGRVVPDFIEQALPGQRLATPRWLERSLPLVSLLALAGGIANQPGTFTLALSLLAAVLHGLRLRLWWVTDVARQPILWALLLACAWLPLGFLGLAAQALGRHGAAVPVHLFAVGAMGGLIMAMASRTLLQYTGRALRLTNGDKAASALLVLAAICRLLPSCLPSANLTFWLGLATACWSLAFTHYLLHHGRHLLTFGATPAIPTLSPGQPT